MFDLAIQQNNLKVGPNTIPLDTVERVEVNQRTRTIRLLTHSNWHPDLKIVIDLSLGTAAKVRECQRLISKIPLQPQKGKTIKLHYVVDGNGISFVNGNKDNLQKVIDLYIGQGRYKKYLEQINSLVKVGMKRFLPLRDVLQQIATELNEKEEELHLLLVGPRKEEAQACWLQLIFALGFHEGDGNFDRILDLIQGDLDSPSIVEKKVRKLSDPGHSLDAALNGLNVVPFMKGAAQLRNFVWQGR